MELAQGSDSLYIGQKCVFMRRESRNSMIHETSHLPLMNDVLIEYTCRFPVARFPAQNIRHFGLVSLGCR